MRIAGAIALVMMVPAMLPAQKTAIPTACVFDTAAHRDTTGIVLSVRVRNADDTATNLRATRTLAAVLRDHFRQPPSTSKLFPLRTWLPGTPTISEPHPDDGIWWMAFKFAIGSDTHLMGIAVLRSSRDSATDSAFVAAIRKADRDREPGVFASMLQGGDSVGVVEFRDGPGVAAVMLHIPRILLDAEVSPRKYAEIKVPKGETGPGEATLRYTVNERGTVDPESIQVIAATNRRFGAAARETILKSTFRPARAGGCPFRTLVEQRVKFGRGGS